MRDWKKGKFTLNLDFVSNSVHFVTCECYIENAVEYIECFSADFVLVVIFVKAELGLSLVVQCNLPFN